MKLFYFFNLPYPKSSSSKEIFLISLLIALTVYFFIIVFQPFGTYTYQHPHKNLILAPYSIIAFITFSFSKIVVGKSTIKKWNVFKEIISIFLILLISSIFNYIYSIYFINHSDFNWYRFLFMCYCSYMIGLPICMIYFFATFSFKMNYLTEKYNEKWDEIIEIGQEKNTQIQSIQLNELYIPNANLNFIFAKSEGNYCSIGFLNEENQVEKKLIRITLSYIENVLSEKNIIRCHRSYLINPIHIISKKGNAQGYMLRLKNVEEEIPVSRNYLSSIIE